MNNLFFAVITDKKGDFEEFKNRTFFPNVEFCMVNTVEHILGLGFIGYTILSHPIKEDEIKLSYLINERIMPVIQAKE